MDTNGEIYFDEEHRIPLQDRERLEREELEEIRDVLRALEKSERGLTAELLGE